MKRLIGWALLLALCAGCLSGTAEDTAREETGWEEVGILCPVFMDGPVTTAESMITVSCPAEGAVRLRITGPDGALFYDTAGSAANGIFVSESIYLPLRGGNTVYTVTVSSDLGTRSVSVTRTQPYLERVHASAGTLPLSVLTGWQSDERILLLRNEDGERRFPLTAGGLYLLGEAVCSVCDGHLTVCLEETPDAQITVQNAIVHVAFTADALTSLIRGSEGVLAAEPGTSIDLQGHEIAVAWVGLTVSFDPALLGPAPQIVDPEQVILWQELGNGEEPLG